MNPKNFFAQLKRRNVYKVAIAYAVVAWLLMQVASQIFPFFEIPNWAVRLVVLLLIIGFPVALILAWAFELTPEGLKRMESADELPKKSARSHAWIYVVGVGAALSPCTIVAPFRRCQASGDCSNGSGDSDSEIQRFKVA